MSNAPKITLLSPIHTRFLFYFSDKLMIRLGFASRCLTNLVGMSSSVSLTLFMSDPTDRAKDDEITYVPQSVSHRTCCGKLASTALCSCFAANHANESSFWGTNTYSIQWQIRGVCLSKMTSYSEESQLKLWHICLCKVLVRQVLNPL